MASKASLQSIQPLWKIWNSHQSVPCLLIKMVGVSFDQDVSYPKTSIAVKKRTHPVQQNEYI